MRKRGQWESKPPAPHPPLVELCLVVGRHLLTVLVLGHQVVHVALDLVELHLVQAFAGATVEESFPPEHCGELLRDALEQFLDGGAVVTDICETGGPMLRKRTEEEDRTVGV